MSNLSARIEGSNGVTLREVSNAGLVVNVGEFLNLWEIHRV